MSETQHRPLPPTAERTDYRSLVQKEHLGQWDLRDKTGKFREVTVEIETIKLYVPRQLKKVKTITEGRVSFEQERLKRLSIRFVGKRKAWLAGPASQDVIAKLYGPIVQDWIGKRLTLFVDTDVEFGRKGNKVGGIRPRPGVPGTNVDLTADPLDNEVDEDKAAELDAAAEQVNEWADE